MLENQHLGKVLGQVLLDLLHFARRYVHRNFQGCVHIGLDDPDARPRLEEPERYQRDVHPLLAESGALEVRRVHCCIADVQQRDAAHFDEVAVILDARVFARAVTERKYRHPGIGLRDLMVRAVLWVDCPDAGAGGHELAAFLAHQAQHLRRRFQPGIAAGLHELTSEPRLVVVVVAVTDQGQVDVGKGSAGRPEIRDGHCGQSAIDGVGFNDHAVDHDARLPTLDDHALVGQLRDDNIRLQRPANEA